MLCQFGEAYYTVGRSWNYPCTCNASSWSLEVDGPWGQVVPPRALQWAFDINFELRTVVASGVGIYLTGRILPLVCELRFCIRILFALFLHFVSYYCVCYMSCM